MSGPWTALHHETRRRVRAEDELAKQGAVLADVRAELASVRQRLAVAEGTAEDHRDTRARIILGAILGRREVQLAVPPRVLAYWIEQYDQIARARGVPAGSVPRARAS